MKSIPFSRSGTYRDGYFTELHGNISSKYTNYKNISIDNLYIAFKRFPHGIAAGNTQYFNYNQATGLIRITASGPDTRFFINGTFYADIVVIK